MRINTNVAALNSQRVLGQTNRDVAQNIGRLSSGFRINKASDDAAGLAIANRMRADARSLGQAARNAEQANSVLQVMEGATTQISGILERMKELATQANSASSGEDSGAAKTQLNDEFEALRNEMDRIANTTTFNGQTLLAGGFGASVSGGTWDGGATGIYDVDLSGAGAATYTVTNGGTDGASVTLSDGTSSQTLTATDGKQTLNFSTFGVTLNTSDDFVISDGTAAGSADAATVEVTGSASGSFMVSSSGSYGANDLVSLDAINLLSSSTDIALDSETVDTAANAQSAFTALDAAIEEVNTQIGKIGTAQNRIDFAYANVQASIENIAAAESTIRDADMAAEMTEFSKNQILQQAGTAMLAQANAAPQSVLALLQ